MLLRLFVSKGARWLDRYDPTWHQRVDPGRLRDDDEHCVLGQAFGNATDFLDRRYFVEGVNGNSSLARRIVAVPFLLVGTWFFFTNGFTVLRDPEAVWRRLWEAEVMERQVGTSAPVEMNWGRREADSHVSETVRS